MLNYPLHQQELSSFIQMLSDVGKKPPSLNYASPQVNEDSYS